MGEGAFRVRNEEEEEDYKKIFKIEVILANKQVNQLNKYCF